MSLVVLNQQFAIYVESTNGIDSLFLLNRASRTRTRLDALPFTQFSQLSVSASTLTLVCIAASCYTSPALVAVNLRSLAALDDATFATTSSNEPLYRVLRSTQMTEFPRDYVSVPELITFPTQLHDGSLSMARALYYAPKNPNVRAPTGMLPPCRILAYESSTARELTSLSPSIQYWTSRGWAICAMISDSDAEYRPYRWLWSHDRVQAERNCAAAAAYLGDTSLPWQRPCTASTPSSSLMITENENDGGSGFSDGTRSITVTRTDPPSLTKESALAFLLGSLAYAISTLVFRVRAEWLWILSALLVLVYRLGWRVQAESLRVFPHLGAQLETHRGLTLPNFFRSSRPYLRLQSARTFLPRDTILDFFMLEAIQHWRVLDCAVLVTSGSQKNGPLHVVFPHLLPPPPVYIHTFRRLHDTLMQHDTNSLSPPCRAIVDPNRICLSGRSVGSLIALETLLLFPGVFCTACSFLGVGDQAFVAKHIQKYALRYITTLFCDIYEGIAGTNKAYAASSHAASYRVPFLLFHSGYDKYLSFQQSRDLVRIISKTKTARVKYLEFPASTRKSSYAKICQQSLEIELAWCTNAALCK